MTIREYFLSTFEPEKLRGKHPVYCHQFLSAITCLELSMDKATDKLHLKKITDADIDAMKEKLLAEGYAPITAVKYRWLLRMVMRHARPEAFPVLSGRHKRDTGDVEPIDEPGTLWSFYVHSYEPHRLFTRTRESKEQFTIAIRKLCTFKRNGALTVLDLSDDLLMDFAQEMHGDGLAIATINHRLAKLKALWRFAVRRKLRLDAPDCERLPGLKRLPEAWLMTDMGRLLARCEDLDGTVSGIPASLFWRALLLVLYDSGVRLRAALYLPRDCIDLDTHWLSVPAELMKNRTEQRFYLHQDTVDAVAAITKAPRERLFPWPWHKRTLYKRYRLLLRAAGLPCGRRDLFHRVRRTSATHLAAAVGIEHASRHLGHSTLQVTAGYIDQTMMPGVRAGDVLPRPIMPQ